MAVRRGHARRLRPQHIGPAAVAVGASSYAITALLAWWPAAPMLVGLLALLVYVGRRDMLELDRMPPARMLRR
jgi:CHASE2 domain-containing sensor protein